LYAVGDYGIICLKDQKLTIKYIDSGGHSGDVKHKKVLETLSPDKAFCGRMCNAKTLGEAIAMVKENGIELTEEEIREAAENPASDPKPGGTVLRFGVRRAGRTVFYNEGEPGNESIRYFPGGVRMRGLSG